MSPPALFCFNAVIFDLDGTLVATDRYWPVAAQAGARRAFQELGLSRPLPSDAQWMSLVGGALTDGFARLLPDLTSGQREHVQMRCVEVEHELLAQGRAAFLPGVEETLELLSAQGLRLGVASNCSGRYLDLVMGDLKLDRWIDEARCLDSPRVRDKADMIEDLLAVFDTRSAVMVGDREGDRDAAWANALPHVHISAGYAAGREEVRAEANLASMDELPALLAQRGEDLGHLADQLVPPGADSVVIGISGDLAAGKTLLASDLAAVLRQRGQACEVLRLGESLGPAESPGVRILVGPRLLDPNTRHLCHKHVYLSVPETVSLERVRGRDGRTQGLGPVERAVQETLPDQIRWKAQHSPERVADRVLDGQNPLRVGQTPVF